MNSAASSLASLSGGAGVAGYNQGMIPQYVVDVQCPHCDGPFIVGSSEAMFWPRPIPASERLPGDDETYLVWWNGRWQLSNRGRLAGDPEIGWSYEGAGGERYYTTGNDDTPTHWLPLPPPPDRE